jgi:hypothetical protein
MDNALAASRLQKHSKGRMRVKFERLCRHNVLASADNPAQQVRPPTRPREETNGRNPGIRQEIIKIGIDLAIQTLAYCFRLGFIYITDGGYLKIISVRVLKKSIDDLASEIKTNNSNGNALHSKVSLVAAYLRVALNNAISFGSYGERSGRKRSCCHTAGSG